MLHHVPLPVTSGRDWIVRGPMQVGYCLEAAELLKKEGISAEVINLRTLKPLDRNTILDSVKKTHRYRLAGAALMCHFVDSGIRLLQRVEWLLAACRMHER